MLRISKTTRLKPDVIIAKAENYFGANGEQLEPRDRNPCCITFAGGGGYVTLTVVSEGKKSTVELETREFEYQARRFLELL